MRHIILAGLLTAGLATSAYAHHPGEGTIYEAGDIVVSHAWTYENEAAAHANHVYLTLDNQGGEADRLLKAEVAFAGQAVFQGQALDADGTLEVRDLSAIKVNPGQVLTLQPGAAWIELEGVTQTFEHGKHFDMTLTFEKAGIVQIEVEVEERDDHDDPAT